VVEGSIAKANHRARISPVFIGSDHGCPPRRHDATKQFLHPTPGCLGVGAPVTLLQLRPFEQLRGPHRATSPQLGVVESIDVVRVADQEIQVHRPILAVLEGAKAVENERLDRDGLGPQALVKEQAVSTQALGEALHRAVGDLHLAGDLPEGGARDEAFEEGLEEAAVAQPVAHLERL